ncbi:MAG TPA: hypothetical protein V6D16_08525 [Candidatus Obscuribacterales bacterium]
MSLLFISPPTRKEAERERRGNFGENVANPIPYSVIGQRDG